MSTVNLDHLQAQVALLGWCKAREAEIADVKKTARAAIEEALGDNEAGSVDGELAITWRAYKARKLNTKALKAKFPDLVEEYTETTEVRRFEII